MLIVQDDREDSSCQICQRVGGKKTEETTEWRRLSKIRGGEEKRNGRLVGALTEPVEVLQMAQASAEELEQTKPGEKKRMASMPQSE